MRQKAMGVKEKIIIEVENLPPDRLQEVLDFVSYLHAKDRKHNGKGKKVKKLDPKKDPLLQYIGGVSHGSLAKDIDRELYGD